MKLKTSIMTTRTHTHTSQVCTSAVHLWLVDQSLDLVHNVLNILCSRRRRNVIRCRACRVLLPADGDGPSARCLFNEKSQINYSLLSGGINKELPTSSLCRRGPRAGRRWRDRERACSMFYKWAGSIWPTVRCVCV